MSRHVHRKIEEVLSDIMDEDMVGCRVSPTSDQLELIYDHAMIQNELEIIAALEARDEDRLHSALLSYLDRNGLGYPYTTWVLKITFFVENNEDCVFDSEDEPVSEEDEYESNTIRNTKKFMRDWITIQLEDDYAKENFTQEKWTTILKATDKYLNGGNL